MRARTLAVLVSLLVVAPVARPAVAQAAGKFPPDSLVNTKVIPHKTPVTEVLGIMRNFTSDLGVRCTFCHVGKEGAPISSFDFPSDEKRTKLTARQMMLMLAEVNRRLDTLPERKNPGLNATCGTCHRGVNRPVPLYTYVGDVAAAAGSDSAIRTYHALRDRYYGRDSYDFGEPSLNIAAFRLARAGKFDDTPVVGSRPTGRTTAGTAGVTDMTIELKGIHHLTAVSAKIRDNKRFYTRTLGMRLVKRSVNQDDVSAYHLFYADAKGTPGTDLTFFDWPVAPEMRGSRSIARTSLRVAGADTLEFWKSQLGQQGVRTGEIVERDGRLTLDVEDLEGQRLALVDDAGAGTSYPWDGSPIPVEHQVRGLGP